ncbi:hypothetical protein Tco_1004755 [Tanacetum coccineum]|uniref:Reverse transcriptase domain-containing protein n=1 Tax=Tanacetum coccineum TaxID=301880 RepID=A0ABQ5FF99_9ASTR
MRTRSSSNLIGNSSSNPTTSNPKRRNYRRSNQRVESFALEESPVVTMADQRTMAELLRAPTEGYAEAIVVPPILAEHFELKHSLINMMTSDQFFGLEKDNPHDHIRWFNKITSTIKYKDVPNHAIKLMLFPFSLAGFDESFHEAWDRYKDLLRACPHHGFTELHQLDTFYNALNPSDQDSLNSAAGGNLLERSTQDVLTIIENKSKVCNSRNKLIVSQVKSSDGNSSSSDIAKLTHACLAADGNTFPEYRDNIQGYVAAAAGNYNQGNAVYRPPGYNRGNNFNQNANYQALIQQNQSVLISELENFKKINDVNMKAMQTQINNVKNELRNEMQSSIQASMSNQTNELKNMMASFFQMNTASTSGTGSLPSNTVANPRGELKAITTRSGLVLDGPTVPMPPPFINPEEDERVEETLTDPEHGEYTIKVPPPQVQKAKPPSQRNFVIHQRDPRYPHIPYPSRMNQEKQKEKDEVQIHKFWQMFKQLHINISLADALILIPKYQKMLKSLLSNKEKLIELANTPLNENCSAVILKKLPEKLGDPGKFLIPCGFSKLKYKALANLGIARDVFVLTARALIDVHGEEMILRDRNERLILNMRNDTSSYSNEPHQESINMIDIYTVSHEDYREDLFVANHLSVNPTSPFFSHTDLTSPEVNDDIFDPEEDIIENLLNLDKTKDLPPYHDNQSSGNPTSILEPETKSSSSSPTLISLEESDLIWEEFEAYLASDSFPPGNSNPSSPLPPFHNSLSGSTTSSSPSLPISEISDYFLEEFANELALITFSPGNDDLPFDAESDLLELEYLLNHDPIKEMDSILEDSVDENSLDDNLDDTISEMFFDEQALDYSSPPLWDEYDDELFDLETVNDDTYNDPFDSKEEKIKDSKILIDELDLPGSSDFLPFPECDSVFYEDFSEVDALPSTDNEDKIFNPGILIHENLFEVTNLAIPEKNVKKTTNASLILEDFNPPLYELPFHKEVPGLGALLSFSSENEEKVFNPGILTSKRVHTSLLPELSHRGPKAFKVTKILESPMVKRIENEAKTVAGTRYEVLYTSVPGTVHVSTRYCSGGGWTNQMVTRGTGVCQSEVEGDGEVRVMTRGFGDLVAKLGDKVVMEVLVRCWSDGEVMVMKVVVSHGEA